MQSLRNMRVFLIILSGQFISGLGTGMTRFALMIWAYEQTGRATTLAMLGFFSFITYVLISPIGGVWVDRLDRRWVMIAGDLGAGAMTLITLGLLVTGNLQIWHLYVTAALTGIFEAFQHPANNAAMTVLVPSSQLVRANSLRSLSYNLSRILAPAMGGLFLHLIGLSGVMLIDVITFSAAVGALLVVRIPSPEASEDGVKTRELSVWQQVRFSLRYIFERRGLLYLMLLFMLINFFAGLTYFGVLPAMVLARSGSNELVLAAVEAALGIGGVVGGIILTIWGGPKRKIHGVLAYCGASFLLGDLTFAIGRTPAAWVIAALISTFFIPVIVSSQRTIWQTKIPADLQGRVLGAAFAFEELPRPIAFLVTGFLADRIMEPALMPGGSLSGVLGHIVGIGPGAGMGAMFLATGILGAAVCFGGYLVPALRNVEHDLPDCPAQPILPVGEESGMMPVHH